MHCVRLRIPLLVVIVGSLLSSASLPARDFFVDGVKGNDRNDGRTPTAAWATLQHATEDLQPGDTVTVSPGVYRGPVQIKGHGKPDQPIILRASSISSGAVVVTNADAAIRAGTVPWRQDDAALGLWSVPYTGPWPARVLYSNTDLYPYSSVERLCGFKAENDAPGPRHGYTLNEAERRLYVRLHASGRYGPSDPNSHRMAVAPHTGEQLDGMQVTAPEHYCFGVLEGGPAYVVIDGFTFETPGVAGVYVVASNVTIRRCWFFGCRTGVVGNYVDSAAATMSGENDLETKYASMRLNPESRANAAAEILVEYCDFTQFPAFEDCVDAIRDPAVGFRYAWIRKGEGPRGLLSNLFKYEIGFVARVARNWVLRRNNVHSVFDGLSSHAVSAAQNLIVEENRFEGMIDNAVETEDHAENVWIVRNEIVDAFMPVSYQPLRGQPWPGPIYCLQNIMVDSPEHRDLWSADTSRVVFKIYPFQWTRREAALPHMAGQKDLPHYARGVGLIAAHNTVLLRNTTISTPRNRLENQRFVNNMFALDRPGPKGVASRYDNNVCAPATMGARGPTEIAAANGKLVSVEELLLDGAFRPRPESPLANAAVPVPEAGLDLPNIGAQQPGDTWYPLKVGPLAGPSRERGVRY